MPMLDVTDVLKDPLFNERLVIIRRVQVIDQTTGITSEMDEEIRPRPIGVVLPQADLPIQRGPEQQTLPRLIEVHTTFRLRSASQKGSKTFMPDFIIWQGDNFYVNRVYDYSKYGPGFVQADCSSQPTIPTAIGP